MSDREVKLAICPRVLKTKRREYEISDPVQSDVSLTTFEKVEIISNNMMIRSISNALKIPGSGAEPQ